VTDSKGCDFACLASEGRDGRPEKKKRKQAPAVRAWFNIELSTPQIEGKVKENFEKKESPGQCIAFADRRDAAPRLAYPLKMRVS
jgi:hypothetical protein